MPAAVDESTEDGPALRDATLTAERIAADEAAAAALRDQQAAGPPPAIAPDEAIAKHLEPDEQLLGLRRTAILRTPGGDQALGYGGTLYLTSRRLVHLGQVIMTVQLRDVVETSIAPERLLLSLNGGEGLTIEVDRPRTFRTEVATAMRALRR